MCERKTNASVLEQLGVKAQQLLNLIKKQKLSYFGHINLFIHFINPFREICLRYSAYLSPHRAAPLMPQQTSTFESHFLTHMQGVAGYITNSLPIAGYPFYRWVGWGKVRVNCFPMAITTWLGWESKPRPPDPESDALTTLPRCPLRRGTTKKLRIAYKNSNVQFH